MSARERLGDAVLAALGRVEGLLAFDAPPVRAAVPYAVVEEPVLVDWSTKSWAGLEGRVSVAVHDEGERPARLREILGRAEAAVAAMGPDLGDGWRIAQVALARSRVARAGGRWVGVGEFVVRVWRAG